MFNKSYLFVLLFFFFFFLSFINFDIFFSFTSFFSFSFEEKIDSIFSGLVIDKISLMFLTMVCFVTSLVFLFSEVYMESYKNKKFLFLTLSFFSFMLILSSASTFMNMMIGWDGLGISSLLLIMFYPNKSTLFNSFLTFFFNRLGDMLFLIFFTFYLSNLSIFFYLNNYQNMLFLIFFFLGLLTKSAQIPFSSWLPAAMSAPTPISAMVHSSTLVTAGIFVFFKFYNFFISFNLFNFLFFFSFFTFILGGFLGALEKDLKKMVAFSTMSQISMILLFLSLMMFSVSILHTLGHAFFKTLLFCACGSLFLWKYSDQISSNLNSVKNFISLSFLFTGSIYSMSGLMFSSSFYTKDLMLELLLESKEMYSFIFLLYGSIFTIIYSAKIFDSLIYGSFLSSFNSMKIFHFFFLFMFSLFLMLFMKIFSELSFLSHFCEVSNFQVFFMNLLILSFFFFKLKLKSLSYFSSEILFLKNFFFGFNSKIAKYFNTLFFLDIFFLKSHMFVFNSMTFKKNFFKFWVMPFMFILIQFMI